MASPPPTAPAPGIDGHPVFAYGSNMHLGDLSRWMAAEGLGTPAVSAVWPARLPAHRLAWCYRSPRRNAGAANVLPCPGEAVPGVVLLVDEATLAALDRKEGHPSRYRRAWIDLELASGETQGAWVYRVTEAWIVPEPEWPSAEYLGLMIEAAQMHGLPAEWVARLEAVGGAAAPKRATPRRTREPAAPPSTPTAGPPPWPSPKGRR